MGMFGWSYPPGAANDPLAPYNQQDGPCAVCGKDCDNCICPVCSICDSQGDPDCYDPYGRHFHGLFRSQEQIGSLADAEASWAALLRCRMDFWDTLRADEARVKLETADAK